LSEWKLVMKSRSRGTEIPSRDLFQSGDNPLKLNDVPRSLK
jgi:hypothetical protein